MGVNQPQARPRRQVRALVSRCARSRRPHPPAEPRFNPARPRGAAGPPAPSGAEPPPPPPDTERCGAERGLPYPGTGTAGGRGNLSAAIAPPEPLLVLRQPPPRAAPEVGCSLHHPQPRGDLRTAAHTDQLLTVRRAGAARDPRPGGLRPSEPPFGAGKEGSGRPHRGPARGGAVPARLLAAGAEGSRHGPGGGSEAPKELRTDTTSPMALWLRAQRE